MRDLSLHTSALNDEEYALYTKTFCDFVEEEQIADDDYERRIAGVREVRAWLRGRYAENMSSADIDTILKLFSANLSHQDTINGNQFFAVMRLIVHSESGKGIDRTLAFVQAHPLDSQRSIGLAIIPPTPTIAQSSPSKLPPLPPRKPAPIAPPRKKSLLPIVPLQQASPPVPTTGKPPKPPPPAPLSRGITPHLTSNLMKQSLRASEVAQSLKRAEEQLEKERVLQVLKSTSNNSGSGTRGLGSSTIPSPPATHTSSMSKPRPPTPPRPLSIPSSSSASEAEAGSDEQPRGRYQDHEPPPLPKRRSTHTASTSHSFSQTSPSSHYFSPPPPTPPPHKTPSSTAPSSSPYHPSPAPSISSLQQVAFATTSPSASRSSSKNPYSPYTSAPASRSSSRPSPRPPSSVELPPSTTTSPSATTISHPPQPPPTHPDRRPSRPTSEKPQLDPFELAYGANATMPMGRVSASTSPITLTFITNPANTTSTPTTRIFRSRSLHQQSSPLAPSSNTQQVSQVPSHPPPVPPLRRKRPESIQVLPSSSNGLHGEGVIGNGMVGDRMRLWDALGEEKDGMLSGGGIGTRSGAASRETSQTRTRSRRVSRTPSLAGSETSDKMPSVGRNGQVRGGDEEGPFVGGRAAAFLAGNTTLSRHHSMSSSASASMYNRHRREMSTPTTPSFDTIASHTPPAPPHPNHPPLSTALINLTNFGKSVSATLQPKFEALQPAIEKVRYKAEAGLAPSRGYVRPRRDRREVEGESAIHAAVAGLQLADHHDNQQQGSSTISTARLMRHEEREALVSSRTSFDDSDDGLGQDDPNADRSSISVDYT